MQYPSAAEVFERCQDVDENKTFLDLWWDDFLQAMSRVILHSLRQLGLKPYSQAVFKHGSKLRTEPRNMEQNETLDRVMEYSSMVGVELVDMLASINSKVEALAPCVPMQHTFGGDGLQNFICNHQDCLEHLEG